MPTGNDEEIERLRAEIAALHERLAEQPKPAAAPGRAKPVIASVVLVLAVITTALALLSVWTFATMTNTDKFVERIGPIIEQPEVSAAIGTAAADRLVTAIDLQSKLEESLPDNLTVLAGPITGAAEQYLAKGATSLVETEAFQQAWYIALAESHDLTISILSGEDTEAVQNTDGVIVLNLAPVVNALISQGSDFLSGVLGRDVSGPTVTADDINEAVAAIEERLGTDLPDDFATITVYSSQELATAQQWYAFMTTAVWLAPLAAAILIALALVLARRRGAALLSLVAGTALLLVAVALLLEPLQAAAVGSIEDDGARAAVSAAFDTALSSLLTRIAFVAAIGVIAAAVLVLARRRSAQGEATTVADASGFAARHLLPLLLGGAGVAVILLLIVPGSSWGQVVSIGICYAGFAAAVALAGRYRVHTATDQGSTA